MTTMIQPILILLLIHLISPAIATSLDMKLALTHVDFGSQFTKLELVQRAALRSKARAAWLSIFLSTTNSGSIARADVFVYPSGGLEYVIDLAIGTPPRPYSAILDTGSDLIWTQCSPCLRCIEQPAPLFNPSKSSTFSTLPCSNELCQAFGNNSYRCSSKKQCIYQYSYGDGTSSQGLFGSETFTFGSTKKVRIPHLGFGCGTLNAGSLNNGSGLVGVGRGPLSLISQLGITKFAYCLTYYNGSKKSSLLLGSLADQYSHTLGPVQTTAILQNPRVPTVYFVPLEGITVGKKRLKIPKSAFVADKNLNGGVVIDSGTALTQLVDVAYKQVKKAFISYMKLPVVTNDTDFDLCFSKSSMYVEVPKLVFHFEGADMDLPRQNYILENEDDIGLMCLLMTPIQGLSIIGNFQQHNFRIVYDVKNNKLSFAPTQCDQL
ncbi:aspartic proteinase nepenthesin-1-like [Typha latifolia]|uniref:aspartic proteinase nepenthesin-1-like n=1 Tax=Typha latifolia TaxID=4733 RepID=UPI003C2B9F9D